MFTAITIQEIALTEHDIYLLWTAYFLQRKRF